MSEALAFARPEDLHKDIIKVSLCSLVFAQYLTHSSAIDLVNLQEFHAKCRASQELIFAQIPWASAGAERSRTTKNALANVRPVLTHHASSYSSDSTPAELTIEEQLLAELLAANEDLLGALRVYEDLERLSIEREAEAISRRDTRMDRAVSSCIFIHSFFF